MSEVTRSDGSPVLCCPVGLWENRAPSTRGKGVVWESIRVDGNRTEVTSHQPEACLLLPGHRSRDKPLTVVALAYSFVFISASWETWCVCAGVLRNLPGKPGETGARVYVLCSLLIKEVYFISYLWSKEKE